MPRMYISTTEFANYPVALAFAGQVARLQSMNGALDRLLAHASKRVDTYCRKRLGAIPATTITTGGASAGATSIPVTSTLGFDGGQEQAVILNPGPSQEIIPILPGGVQVSSWISPYPGVLLLTTPTANAHSAGETAQGCYQEVSAVGSSSSSDIFSQSALEMNQAAQLARAHAPQFDTAGLTRVIFLKQYPIQQLYKLEHMLPIDTQYSALDSSQAGVHPSAGYIRLPLGSFVLPEGLFRSTYTAGYQYVPDEVQEATALYAADALQSTLSFGASQMQQGAIRGVYRNAGATKSNYVQDAENILDQGNYRRRS